MKEQKGVQLLGAVVNDFRPALLEAMAVCQIEPEALEFTADGNFHHFKCKGDSRESGWYILHVHQDVVAGKFGCFKRGVSQVFSSRALRTLSGEERRAIQEKIRAAEAVRASELKALREKAMAFSRTMLLAPNATNHPYLQKKGVPVLGRLVVSSDVQHPGWLALPLVDTEGKAHTLEFIADDGTKKLLYGGEAEGHFIHIPGDAMAPLIICEGYATGASIHMALGWEVACAYCCGNLLPCGRVLRGTFPDRTIIFAADNDQFTEKTPNPGKNKAIEAAKASKAMVVWPEFSDEALAGKPTDFNDLHRLAGLKEVERQIVACLPRESFYRCRIERAFRFEVRPPTPPPVFCLRGIQISSAGNLAVISSTIKAGKSSVVCAMAASTMSPQGHPDFLEFSSANPDSKAVLHFDTEQSDSDHDWHIRQLIRRAGLEREPPWFHSWHLLGMSWQQTWAFIRDSIPYYARLHNGVLTVLIDGVGDLVPSVNDEIQCNQRTAELLDLGGFFRSSVITVIHLNPGSDFKTRGHLGSQLERKSESNLKLEKNGVGIKIWGEAQRHVPIPANNAVWFAWSEEYKMHTILNHSPKDDSKCSKLSTLFTEIFQTRPAMRFFELRNAIIEIAGCKSQTTAENRINDAIYYHIIEKSVANLYTLTASNGEPHSTPEPQMNPK